MKLEVGALSDVGGRDHNEDSLAMYRPAEPGQLDRKGELFLVADGIGGHQAGEVASRLAVEQVVQIYANSPGQDALAELVQGVEAVNAVIYELGQAQGQQRRMGTTLVGALVRGHDLHVINVGDSRAYLVRNQRPEQVSQDHSLVAEQIRMGLLDPERAESVSYRSAITRALGSKPKTQVDVFARTLQAGDVIVLCTDGLSGLVKDDEIARLASSQPPGQAAEQLVGLANTRGSRDNITVIVIKADRAAPPASGAALRWLLLAALLFVLVGLVALVPFRLGWGSRAVPRTAPVIAPFALPGCAASPEAREDYARMLGYADWIDMILKNEEFDPPTHPVHPWQLYVLLAGQVTHVEAGPGCNFSLEQGYSVVCTPGVQVARGVSPARGEQVRVLGSLPGAQERQIEPLVIDVNTLEWLGLVSEWETWYSTLQPGHRLLVYTLAGAYPAQAEGRELVRDYGLRQGEPVAVYGLWATVQGQAGQYAGLLSVERVFRLDSAQAAYEEVQRPR